MFNNLPKIYLRGPVGSYMEAAFEYQLQQIPKNIKEVVMIIDSPGGGVRAGFKIIDRVEALGFKVHVLIHGTAASMASIIAMSATGKTYITRNSTFHLHQISALTFGKLGDMQDDVGFFEKLQNRLNLMIKNRTGLSDAKIKEMMSREHYLVGEEAVQEKLIDAVYDEKEHGSIKSEINHSPTIEAFAMKFSFKNLLNKIKNFNDSEFKESEVNENNAEAFESAIVNTISNLESQVSDKDKEIAQLKTDHETALADKDKKITSLESEVKTLKETNESDDKKTEAEKRAKVLDDAVKANKITPATKKSYESDDSLKALDSNQLTAIFKDMKPVVDKTDLDDPEAEKSKEDKIEALKKEAVEKNWSPAELQGKIDKIENE